MFDPDNAIMKSSSTLDEDYIYQAIKLWESPKGVIAV